MFNQTMRGGQELSLLNSHFPFFIFFVFFIFSVLGSPIPLNSKLTLEEKNSWVSSDGNFAVGFFNRSNLHSLGIRFNSNSIPNHKQTLVWVAGADITVGEKSYFQLTQLGELILFDSTRGAVVWTSKTSNSSVGFAVIRIDGNLILLDNKQNIVWQSFNIPSDTLLPGQSFSNSQTLRAASRNSLSSYYTLHILQHLQLKWESSFEYWKSGNPSQLDLRFFLGSNGTLQLLDQKSNPVWSIFGDDHGDADAKFRFLRLDVDGNLRLYSWVPSLNSWRSVWQAVENQCNVFDTCGLCGVCVFNSSNFPVCKCPFSLTSESNSKCLIPYRQDCKYRSSMDILENTLLYGVYPFNDTIMTSSLDQCKRICQQDPLCFALTFRNVGTPECKIMKTKYVSGYSDASESSVSFIKRCLDPIAVFPVTNSTQFVVQESRQNGVKKISLRVLIAVICGAFFLVILFHLGIGFWIYKKRLKSYFPKSSLVSVGQNPNGFLVLSYSEIKNLTEDFKNQIGPNMFKGVLANKKVVAVKKLNITTDERKFRCLVLKISSISHKNLVKLEGYCCEPGQNQRYLLYEFAKKGSLTKCLQNSKICKKLTWRKRMEICLTVAKSISYLHNGCREFVSHGNLKGENIILDEKFEAKVSEFGLVNVSAEVDVLAFGNMVLKLVSGRQDSDSDFIDWVYEKLSEGGSHEVLDQKTEGGADFDEVSRVLRIALWCLQNDERMRPSIGEVVKVLEGTLTVDLPPPPFSRRVVVNEDPAMSDSE